MNYLAHAYLSCNNESLLIGNMITDMCRKKELNLLNKDIQEGVTLHRSIDHFTDSHPQWKKSTSKFFKRHGKYASVLTDLFYDYYLIKNWDTYSSEHLGPFTTKVYEQLLKNLDNMPSRITPKIQKMVDDDYLTKYSKREGLQRSLEWMDKRTKFPSVFKDALLDLDEYDQELNEEFNLFFPELINHVNAFCKI